MRFSRSLLIALLVNGDPHTATRVTFDPGIGMWNETQLYVCRGQTLWVFDYQGARMTCATVVADTIYRGGFGD